MDEPIVGIDAESALSVKYFMRYFSEKKEGIVIFSTHIFEIAKALADYIVILNKGDIVASGTLKEILSGSKSKNLEEVFLNLTGGAKYNELLSLLRKDGKISKLF